MKIKLFFRWYDLWIGLYIDKANKAIYICPIPMFGIKIWKEVPETKDILMTYTVPLGESMYGEFFTEETIFGDLIHGTYAHEIDEDLYDN